MSLTAPTTNGKFSFAADCFYVESSGKHLHRRATIPELQAHFQPHPAAASKSHDNFGHWYEAQLLHYGIPASKTKAVAKMRLFDAVQSGSLAVPKEIERIEADLMKQWKKKDRLARAGKLVEKEDCVAAAGGLGDGQNGNKRKREDTATDSGKRKRSKENKTAESKEEKQAKTKKSARSSTAAADVPVEGKESGRSKKVTAAGSTEEKTKKSKKSASDVSGDKESRSSKKTKAAGSAEEKTTKTKSARSSTGDATAGDKKSDRSKEIKTSSSTPQATNTVGSPAVPTVRETQPSRSMEAAASTTERRPPRTKQTARRSRPFSLGARQSDRPEVPMEPQFAGPIEEAPRRTKLTARRGGAFVGGRRWTSDYTKEEYPQHGLPLFNSLDPAPIQSDEADLWQPSESSSLLGQLGLINGEYDIRAPWLEEEWPNFVPDEGCGLTLVLNRSRVWGAYDLGMFKGILNMQRPQRASYTQLPFEWRGREMSEGQMSFGPGNQGWIQFLGDGRIEGVINCYGWARFSGRRVSGQDARAPRNPVDMQDEWDQYNQVNYDRECADRWH